MLNRSGIESMTPAQASEEGERRGVALITALFGVVVLAIMMSGMYFSSNQEYRGTRNALVEQRGFAVAEYGLNSEISNWDRTRNQLVNFGIGAIDGNQVYVAEGDTAWVNCVEEVTSSYSSGFSTASVQATNIFVRRDGEWRLVHHHASAVPTSGDETVQ